MATAKPRIPCKPVMVARSDGATTFTVRNGQAPEPNEPTREQKINTPSADGSVDYYRPVQPDGDKDLDWRRKLGQWLVLSFDSKNEHKGKSSLTVSLAGSNIIQTHNSFCPVSQKIILCWNMSGWMQLVRGEQMATYMVIQMAEVVASAVQRSSLNIWHGSQHPCQRADASARYARAKEARLKMMARELQ